LPSGVLPNYHPFWHVMLLWLVIALELFVHVRVSVSCGIRDGWCTWAAYFASNYGKRLQRLMKLLKAFRVISAWGVHVAMNGLSDLRTVGSQHITSRLWDGPQRHVTTLVLHKFMKSFVLIVVWQCVHVWHSYGKIRNASGSFEVCPMTSDTSSERESRSHLSGTSRSH
jgi:hypothetical protein